MKLSDTACYKWLTQQSADDAYTHIVDSLANGSTESVFFQIIDAQDIRAKNVNEMAEKIMEIIVDTGGNFELGEKHE